MSNARDFARIAQNVDSSGRSANETNPIFKVRPNTVAAHNFSGIYLDSTTYWQTPEVNVGSCWDSSTGKFTAPRNGRYFFAANLRFDNYSGSYIYYDIRVNQNRELRSLTQPSFTYYTFSLSGVLELSTDDYVQLWANSVGDSSVNLDSDSDFTGMLIG
jgi:hypothetical protein